MQYVHTNKKHEVGVAQQLFHPPAMETPLRWAWRWLWEQCGWQVRQQWDTEEKPRPGKIIGQDSSGAMLQIMWEHGYDYYKESSPRQNSMKQDGCRLACSD